MKSSCSPSDSYWKEKLAGDLNMKRNHEKKIRKNGEASKKKEKMKKRKKEKVRL